MIKDNLQTLQLSTQGDFYQILSRLLIHLKRILTTFQKLVILKQKYLQYDQYSQVLTIALKNITQYVIKMPNPNTQDQLKTFHRVIIRIYQVTQFHRYKYQELHASIDLILMIKQAQSQLILNIQEKQYKKNLLAFLRVIRKHSIKYQPFKQLQQINEKISPQRKISQDLINQKKPKLLKKQFSIQVQNFSFDKIIAGFNKYLQTISCLDNDSTNLRSAFFKAKGNQKTSLQAQILARNSFILKGILNYSKLFKQYIQRKQLKTNIFKRRNKFLDKSIQNRVKTAQSYQPVQQPFLKYKQQQEIEKKFLQDKKKVQYSQQFQQKYELLQQYRRKRAYEMKTMVFSGNILNFDNEKKLCRKGANSKKLNKKSFNPQFKNIRVTTVFANPLNRKYSQVNRTGLKDIKKALFSSFQQQKK